MFHVSVLSWNVEVFGTSRSLVQRNPTECDISELVEVPHRGGLGKLVLPSHEAEETLLKY
jgi:hypothetical protein